MFVVPGNVLQYKDVDVVVGEVRGELTHLDSEDDLAAMARVLALHWTELTDCLMTQAGAEKCGHWAALGPEQNTLYLEMRAEIFCSNMSRSVTATTEIKINMSTRDDINISKGSRCLCLVTNVLHILIILTKPWLQLFLQINDFT